MNYCVKCSKIIRTVKLCNICDKYFCSDSCLKHHIYTFHYNENNENYSKQLNDKNNNQDIIYKNKTKNNFIELSYTFSSPYLTRGSMAIGKILYDNTYSLKNFRPVIENGKEVIIGSGSYGKVFLAINNIDKKYYAIKHMKKKDIYKNLKSFRGIYKEIDIQSRINHPNIVKLFYVKENKDAFDLVMEYAKYGNLFYYIKRNNYLSEEKSFQFFMQVVNAVYFLHKNDLIHRDIKPENILMFENKVLKLCDFGWCTKLNGGQRITFCGTVEYMSPEMVNKEEYSKEIDIWSLGILLYEMIHGHSPFKPDKPKFNMNDVIGNIKIKDLKFSKDISEECKELILHLLDRDTSKRYKIEDIYKSKFVKFYENQKKFFLNKDAYINPTVNKDKDKDKKNNKNYNECLKHHKDKNDVQNDDVQDVVNLMIANELQKMKCKAKNNTARNFYQHPLNLEKNKEKEILDNNNNNKNKCASHCKVKKTVNKFDKNIIGITPRYISQDNLNNFFKKPNVKEKEKDKKPVINSNSATDLFCQLQNNEIKCQSISTRKLISNNEASLRNNPQSLTNRYKKCNQTAKNRQISMDNIAILNDNKSSINYNINNICSSSRTRLKSYENYYPNKIVKKSKELFNNNYIIEEDKVPLITEIGEDNNNNDDIKGIEGNKNKKRNTKVKVKILEMERMEGINQDEKKINIINYINNTGKRNTKVKNFYRSNNKIQNNTLNNKTDINYPNNNHNCNSTPQISVMNNNLIYNRSIIKYSTFINNKTKSNNQKKIEDSNKNIIRNNLGDIKASSSNNGIILLPHNNNNNNYNNEKFYWPKSNMNKDNNCSNNETIKDLDETPKKDIDNLKIMPYELLNNFTKELNGYMKKE